MPTRIVSIIVITYNAKDDLKECLQSLVTQDYSEIEIIVVNDASTDGTAELVEDFIKTANSDITVVTNRTNLGVAGSRNAGIRHAKGDVIAFTDSDCVADHDWVSELVRSYECNDVAAVGGKILDARMAGIWNVTNKGHDFVASQEGYVPFIKGCNMSFKGDLLRGYMFNDEIKYGYEELLLCDSLTDNGYKIYYNPRAVVHHKHRTSLEALLKQKYLRGMSSVWYLRKRNMFFMYRRHFILLLVLILLPLIIVNKLFMYPAIVLLSIFSLSLLREEIIFKEKNIIEMVVTFPFLVIIEFAHFAGACSGVARFRILKRSVTE